MTPGSDEYLTVVQQVARVTLAISVMGAALRLPEGYVRRHWRELTLILGLGLPLMSLSGSVLAYLILPVPLLTAFLIGSLLAPTDPVLAHSVITGKTADENIPARLRNSITAESGANDGLALLLVMFPVLLLTYPPGEAVAHWLTETVAWGVLGAIAVGLGLGWLAGKMLVWAYAQPFSERVSGLTASVALALATVAWVHLIGSSGILAAFAAGLVFQRFLVRVEDPRTEHVQEAIGRFFDLPVFVLFGLSVPWHDWLALDRLGVHRRGPAAAPAAGLAAASTDAAIAREPARSPVQWLVRPDRDRGAVLRRGGDTHHRAPSGLDACQPRRLRVRPRARDQRDTADPPLWRADRARPISRAHPGAGRKPQ
jgi:NhaP-type Na+/H+ or K+/H+ antiporter